MTNYSAANFTRRVLVHLEGLKGAVGSVTTGRDLVRRSARRPLTKVRRRHNPHRGRERLNRRCGCNDGRRRRRHETQNVLMKQPRRDGGLQRRAPKAYRTSGLCVAVARRDFVDSRSSVARIGQCTTVSNGDLTHCTQITQEP